MAKTIIKSLTDGPYQVSGQAEIHDAQGEVTQVQPGQDKFLCRCGKSSNKPFCDGAHNKTGFKSEV